MGYDFDTSGHYVGWSPYFNFNSIESLKASEMLPTPNGKLYAYGSGGVDISNYLNQLNKENFYNPESVPVIAEMLNAIDDARILTYSGEVDTDNANFILNRINNHTMYMTEEFDENGNDMTPILIDHINEKGGGTPANIYQAEFPLELLHSMNMVPCGYHRYYYMKQAMLEHAIEEFNEGGTRAEQMKQIDFVLFVFF